MGYYLIKQWTPHRGTTRDNPSCFFCGGMIYRLPLGKVKSYDCYTSRKRAERIAAKHCTLYSHAEVVELPDEIVEKYRYDKELNQYVPVD